MGIASDLRQSVLQAAVQGKLTTQKAEDGDARELLRAIREEKEKLVKEKKSKKEKPLAPISDEEIPFDIPDNWVWCKLGELVSVISGTSYNKSEVKSNGLRIFRGGNLEGTNLAIHNDDVFLDQARFYDSNKCIQKSDIVIVASTGSVKGIGRAAFCDKELSEECQIGAFLRIIRCFNEALYPYIRAIFNSFYYRNWISTKVSGIGIKNVKAEHIYNLLIPLPPLPEQRRIVARVDALMKEIDKLEQTEKELEAIKAAFPGDMKASLLQAAVQGKLTTQKAEDGDARELLRAIREEKEKLVKEKKSKKEKPLAPISDEEIPFDIPDNWVWCKLGELVSVISGTSYNKSEVKSNGLRIFRGGNLEGTNLAIHNDDVFLDQARFYDSNKCIQKSDIVIVASTGSVKGIGRAAFCDKELSEECQIGAFLRIIRCFNEALYPYIRAIFNSFYYRNWISTKVSGIGIKNVKAEHIYNLLIPLPPLPEQQRIVEKLDQLLPLCDSLSEH